MEELQTRHRKEQRDLQSQITQKKKQASKKTRKSVNDECDRLESELQQRQKAELDDFNGTTPTNLEPTQEDLDALTLGTENNNDETSTTTNPLDPSIPPTSTTSPDSQPRKPNRQKARLARRAAEQESQALLAAAEAQNLPDLKQQERERMLAAMAQHHLSEKEIRADGHCLYSAVADQLIQQKIPLTPATDAIPVQPFRTIRLVAAEYMQAHRQDFEAFLEEPWEEYVFKVRETGEWGGQMELMALARSYGIDIHVLQDFGRVEKIEGGEGMDGSGRGEKREIWLGYYKHGFGLGEHYNSLRKA